MKSFIQGFIRDVSALGGIPVYCIVTALFFFLSPAFFLILCFGFVIAVFLTAVVRAVHFKQRPQKQEYNTFLERLDASSFPSLHTMRATILFTTAALFFQNALLQMLFFLVIPCVAAARVLLKKHDLIDVMGGFFFGVLIFGFLFSLF